MSSFLIIINKPIYISFEILFTLFLIYPFYTLHSPTLIFNGFLLCSSCIIRICSFFHILVLLDSIRSIFLGIPIFGNCILLRAGPVLILVWKLLDFFQSDLTLRYIFLLYISLCYDTLRNYNVDRIPGSHGNNRSITSGISFSYNCMLLFFLPHFLIFLIFFIDFFSMFSWLLFFIPPFTISEIPGEISDELFC